MKQSTERILTTHVGSLPRPSDLLEMIQASGTSTGFSTSQNGHASGFNTAGMRLWSWAHDSFG